MFLSLVTSRQSKTSEQIGYSRASIGKHFDSGRPAGLVLLAARNLEFVRRESFRKLLRRSNVEVFARKIENRRVAAAAPRPSSTSRPTMACSSRRSDRHAGSFHACEHRRQRYLDVLVQTEG